MHNCKDNAFHSDIKVVIDSRAIKSWIRGGKESLLAIILMLLCHIKASLGDELL